MKTLSYSKIKYTPRVPLILITVEKIEHQIFDFIFLLSFFLSFFFFLFFFLSLTHKSKSIRRIRKSAHQATALLSEIILFLARASRQLRSPSYGLKRTSRTLSIRYFGCSYAHNSKTKGRIKTLYLTNNCSTIGDIYFLS